MGILLFMPLVFDNIARFTIVGSYEGEDCMNVFDVEVDDIDPLSGPRSEELFRIAGDIINNWSDHILPLVASGYSASEVRWVDLDTLDGTTGSRSSTTAETWPQSGGNPGAALPGNVYQKVVKRVEGKTRRERNGIVRLGGVPEAATDAADGNRLSTTHIGQSNAAFEQFKDGINVQADGYEVNLGVLHTSGGVASGFSQISTFSTEQVVGTIRRRMPGYGS